MKVTFLFLIVCLTEIYAYDQHQIFRECFRENGEDFDALTNGPKMTEAEVISRVTLYKLGCISVCYLKKKLVDPIPIRKYINDSLNESHPDLTDAEIAIYKNEVKKCTEAAKTDDCKLMECLKPWSLDTRIGEILRIP